MYDFIPIILGAVVFGLGLFMSINPKACTKKELQQDSKALAKTKSNGSVLGACGVTMIIIGIAKIFIF